MYAVIESGRVVQYAVGFRPEGNNVIKVPPEVAENRCAYEYKGKGWLKRPEPNLDTEAKDAPVDRIAELERTIVDLTERVARMELGG